jgi:hypothetical protein
MEGTRKDSLVYRQARQKTTQAQVQFTAANGRKVDRGGATCLHSELE